MIAVLKRLWARMRRGCEWDGWSCWVECELCGELFTDVSAIRSHAREKHPGEYFVPYKHH